jgi:hypothetical protein
MESLWSISMRSLWKDIIQILENQTQINFVYVLLCSFDFLCILSGLIHVGSDIMAFLELFQGTENSMHSSPVGARRWCEPSHLPLGPGALKVAFNGWIVVGLGQVTWHDLPRTVKRGGLCRENKGCAEVFHWKFISSVFHDGGHILHCLESSLLGTLLPICCNSTGLTHFSSDLQDWGNMISVLILRKPPWVSTGAGA